MPDPRPGVEAAHNRRVREANGYRDAYRLIHHRSRPFAPSRWERTVYGPRPTSSRRILVHLLILAVPTLLALLVVALRAPFPIAVIAASAVAAVTALILSKGNVATAMLLPAAAAAGYAFIPSHLGNASFIKSGYVVPHWQWAAVVLAFVVGIFGVQNIRYAYGRTTLPREPANPRMDKFVTISGIASVVLLVPAMFLGTGCLALLAMPLLWAFVCGIPQWAAILRRAYFELRRGASFNYNRLLLAAATAHWLLREPFARWTWAAAHEQASARA